MTLPPKAGAGFKPQLFQAIRAVQAEAGRARTIIDLAAEVHLARAS